MEHILLEMVFLAKNNFVESCSFLIEGDVYKSGASHQAQNRIFGIDSFLEDCPDFLI